MKSLPVVGIFSALLALSASSVAEERLETQFDADLVDADAIVIASVASISAVNAESAEVALTPVRVVANRWDTKTALSKVRVQRSVTQSDTGPSLKLPDRPELLPGGTYLFLLRGGIEGKPFLDSVVSILRISESGDSVECSSGHVYGITKTRLICGDQQTYYGPPLTVDEVSVALERQLNRAKRIRVNRFNERVHNLKPLLVPNKVTP